MTDLLGVIDCLVVELQGVAGAKGAISATWPPSSLTRYNLSKFLIMKPFKTIHMPFLKLLVVPEYLIIPQAITSKHFLSFSNIYFTLSSLMSNILSQW